jgi:glutathione synthase/RimK-type ligase-like ATP-grasp enzyme
MRIAFATYRSSPVITDDDRLVVHALAAHGIDVVGIPWDAPERWDAYSAVLPRSTWDFHHRLPEFQRWLADLTASGVPTLNPTRLLEWNVTKHYLRSLDARGVEIVPTLWAEPDMPVRPGLADIMSRAAWTGHVVVKPVVSASGHDTWVARGREPAQDERRFEASLSAATHGLMLQPFLPEVQAEGEWSVIFLGGQFSHAVLKRPAAGDFRVQESYGGSTVPRRPAAHVVEAAARAVQAAADCTRLTPAEILYARVDGVVRDGRFVLMEFEAVEPVLFFASAPAAAGRMASLIRSALEARRTGH